MSHVCVPLFHRPRSLEFALLCSSGWRKLQGFTLVCRMMGKPRSLNNPDDVFYAEVQRPLDDVITNNSSSCRNRPSSYPYLLFEDHRRLCNAVIDGRADMLRSLLVDSELDANARSSTGATAGHQVGPCCDRFPQTTAVQQQQHPSCTCTSKYIPFALLSP